MAMQTFTIDKIYNYGDKYFYGNVGWRSESYDTMNVYFGTFVNHLVQEMGTSSVTGYVKWNLDQSDSTAFQIYVKYVYDTNLEVTLTNLLTNEESKITYVMGEGTYIVTFDVKRFSFSGLLGNATILDNDPQGHWMSDVVAAHLEDLFDVEIEKISLQSILKRISSRLYRWNKKLDYYLNITSSCTIVSHEIASNYSGVTIAAHAVRLIGNSLNISVRLSLTSTAQNNIGTGNITNLQLCTITIDDFWNNGSPSSDEATNLSQIANASASGSMCSGYSAGNAQPASFHYTTSRSGSTLTISCVLDALYSKTSEMRFTADIPVLRVKSYYH